MTDSCMATNFFHNHDNSAMKPGLYKFLVCVSLLALFVFMCDRKRGYNDDLGFIDFYKSIS